MSVFRTAFVYVRNDFAGVLKETDEGYSFKYDTDYLQSESHLRFRLLCRCNQRNTHLKPCSRFLMGLFLKAGF